MNLLDLMVDEPSAPPASPQVPRLERDDRVRMKDGRVGEVVVHVVETDRVCVRFPGEQYASFIHRQDLEVIELRCPHRKWNPTETIWPGESEARLTETCAECRLVRGRM